jgi:hypothetical protein
LFGGLKEQQKTFARRIDVSIKASTRQAKGVTIVDLSGNIKLGGYSSDVNGLFQRDVNERSGDVNKVGAKRRWSCNHA